MMRDVESPQEFIDWSFRWLIAASLQRRVWVSIRGQQLYPNIYLFLVAEPGIGKGQSLKPAKELLSWHKWHDKSLNDVDSILAKLRQTPCHKDDLTDAILSSDKQSGASDDIQKKNLSLFPVGPDATTYEQLIQDMAASTRCVMHSPDANGRRKMYTHNSFAFISTELSNLIKKGTDSIVNFMLEAYDCSEKYEYRTKHQGKDCVHRVCLNFAGGTTPDYMAKTFDDSLLNEGMSSRSFFIFGYGKRFYKLESAAVTDDQLHSKATLLAHIRKLSQLYGEVKLTPEAWQMLKTWYQDIYPNYRVNRDQKMVHYYSRKDLHVMKTAMALHFADSTEMTLTTDDIQNALDVLEHAEKSMHLALQVGNRNPLANVSRKITKFFLARGNAPCSFAELLREFFAEVREADLKEIVNYMVSARKLIVKQAPNGLETYCAVIEHAVDMEPISAAQAYELKATVHATLDAKIRWGRNGKIIIPKGTPMEEIIKLRKLISGGDITGVTSIKWEE